jgi:hypothetical protein
MADTGVIDLDTSVVVEKRGRGRPCGSRNKPKDISLVASSSAAPLKRRPGRPLGSKTSSSLAEQPVEAPIHIYNIHKSLNSHIFTTYIFQHDFASGLENEEP